MNKNPPSYVQLFSELGKLKISFFVSLSTLTGYVLASGTFSLEMLLPTIGVFLMAAGSSALNHFQERELDSLMERTKNRPLPAENISPQSVLIYTVLLFTAGTFFLGLNNIYSVFLGFLAVIWYNLIYTNLKRETAWAVVPGALVGAIPPLIGWVAAGGNILNFKALILSFFFFMGQIPHFWLILIKYGKEYEAAGYPSITLIFNNSQIKRLSFTWIAALAVASGLFLQTGLISSFWLAGFLVLFSGLLILSFGINIFTKKREFKYGQAFFHLNLYFLLIMILLCLSIFPTK